MDAGAFIKQHWKALAIAGAGLAALYIGSKLIGGGGSTSASDATVTPAATGTDPSAMLAAMVQAAGQQASLQAQTTLGLGQLDAQTYAATVQAQGQIGQQAIAAAASENIANVGALSQGFSNFVNSTAQEVSATASAAGNLGAANDRAVSQNIAAMGQLLAGAGALVGAVTGSSRTLTSSIGLPSGGFAGAANTNLPLVLVPTTNAGLLQKAM